MNARTGQTERVTERARVFRGAEETLVFFDRGELVTYTLGWRRGTGQYSGPGWTEATERGGEPDRYAVSAAHVIAVLREADRHVEAERATLRFAAALERTGHESAARRLRCEVAAGRAMERVGLRRIQAEILRRLADGEQVSVMCERGRFVERDGRPDTSWFMRRAGLMAMRCGRTGRTRIARTCSYEHAVRFCDAVGLDYHELGI